MIGVILAGGDGHRVLPEQRVAVPDHGAVVLAAHGQLHRAPVLPGRQRGGRRHPGRARGLAAVAAADARGLDGDLAHGHSQRLVHVALHRVRALGGRMDDQAIALAGDGHARLRLHVEVQLRAAARAAVNDPAGDAAHRRALLAARPVEAAPRPLHLPDVHRVARGRIGEDAAAPPRLVDGEDGLLRVAAGAHDRRILSPFGGDALGDVDGQLGALGQHQPHALAAGGHLSVGEDGVIAGTEDIGAAGGDVGRGDVIHESRVARAQPRHQRRHLHHPVAAVVVGNPAGDPGQRAGAGDRGRLQASRRQRHVLGVLRLPRGLEERAQLDVGEIDRILLPILLVGLPPVADGPLLARRR